MAEQPSSENLKDLTLQVRTLEQQHRQLFRQLLSEERRLRSLARTAWRVQEEERRRLAGELHDGLGQILTALKIHLELQARQAARDSPALAADLERSAEFAGTAVAEARRLSHLLRPQVLDDLGLGAALRWLARTLSEGPQFRVELHLEPLEEDTDGEAVRFDPELETLIFRVAQEALTNALKHSGAGGAALSVRLDPERSRLHLEVRDHGAGFDVGVISSQARADGSRAGQGLQGMRDRVAIFGGHLTIHSAPGEGTVITAEIPL